MRISVSAERRALYKTYLWLQAIAILTASAQPIQIIGPSVPSLAAFDKAITDLMARHQIPGGALAITRNGKLVLAHGYGMADVANGLNVQPDSLFRIASLSKQLTSVAILKLVQDGKLSLDTKAFDLLPNLQPPAGKTADPRLRDITVRMLLQHSGGWDANLTFDVNTRQFEAARAVGATSPGSSETMIRYMMGFPLDFNPGERYAYANVGYLVLGRIIEKITGLSYEQYVRTQVLAPIGIHRMHIAQTLPMGAGSDEVKYYMPPGTADVRTIFPFGPALVPWPYGAGYLEAYDANGGWIGSAVDLIKFWNALDGRRGVAVLDKMSIAQLTARPANSTFANGSFWYGLGFAISPVGNDTSWGHGGALPGCRSYAVRYASTLFNSGAFNYVALFNLFPDGSNIGQFVLELDAAMTTTIGSITIWPEMDLFVSFPSAGVAPPSINAQEGVVQGATFQRGIVPGSWITIRGANLSTTTRIWSAADIGADGSLPVELDGVRVNVNGRPAAIYYVSPDQINAQAPYDASRGGVVVEVVRGGVTSRKVVAELRDSAPGFFSYLRAGKLYAAAVHLDGVVVGDPDVAPGTRVSKSGDVILMYGSGFAPSPSGEMLATPIPLPVLPIVRFGDVVAKVEFAGLVAPGLFQLNVVVPSVPNGANLVTATYAGTIGPSVVIAVRQ